MNPSLFHNRAADGSFGLPDDGWYHVAPKGEFPHPESGLVQVIDDAALTAMVDRFQQEAAKPNFPGLLVDFDHFSYDTTKSSEAAGWIREIQNRQDGLFARIVWSDLGEAAVKKGRFRLISPTWLPRDVEKIGNNRIRPLRLDTAGLTNQPNLRGMVPLSNRAPGGDADKTETHDSTTMKSIAAQVGLSADASEQSVLDAVKAILNRATTAETRVTTLETEVTELKATNKSLLEAQVETDLKLYGNRFKPEAREKWKAQLLANRASTIELLAELPEIGGKPPASANHQPMHNRANTQNPGANGRDAAESDDAETARKQSTEIETYRLANRCSYEAARNAVRQQKPELFGLAK